MESRVEGEYGGCDGMMIVGDLFLIFFEETGDFPENSKSRGECIKFLSTGTKTIINFRILRFMSLKPVGCG